MEFNVFLLTVTLLLGNYFGRKLQKNDKELEKSNTNFVSGMLYENASYCPHINTCMYKYNAELIDTSDSSRCCKPCQCENNYCEHMTCCPDIMPCTNPAVEQVNQRLVCIPTTIKRKRPVSGVLSIATCSAKNSEVEQKCQEEYDISNADINDITPVRDVNSHYTYRNIHCALCNGISMHNIKYWLLNVSCEHDEKADLTEESTLLESISKIDDCDLTFNNPDPEVAVNQCSFEIDTCNVTGGLRVNDLVIETSCLETIRDVRYYKGMFFKNKYCGACNGVSAGKSEAVSPSKPPAFSILMSFGRRTSTAATKCDPGMLFHESKERCVEARCSPLRQLRNNVCERTIHKLGRFDYRIGLRLKPKSTVNVATGFTAIAELVEQLNNFLESVFGSIVRTVYEITIIADVEFHEALDASEILQANLLWYELRLKLQGTESHDPEEKLEALLSLANKEKLGIVTNQEVIIVQVMLKDDTGYVLSNTLAIDSSRCSYSLTETFSPCSKLDPRTVFKATYPGKLTAVPYIGQYMYDKSDGQFYNRHISFERNVLEFRNCPFIKVLKNNTFWKENDTGLEFISHRFILTSSDFVYGETTDSIWVCLEKYNILFNSGNLYYPTAVLVMNAGMFVIAVH